MAQFTNQAQLRYGNVTYIVSILNPGKYYVNGVQQTAPAIAETPLIGSAASLQPQSAESFYIVLFSNLHLKIPKSSFRPDTLFHKSVSVPPGLLSAYLCHRYRPEK